MPVKIFSAVINNCWAAVPTSQIDYRHILHYNSFFELALKTLKIFWMFATHRYHWLQRVSSNDDSKNGELSVEYFIGCTYSTMYIHGCSVTCNKRLSGYSVWLATSEFCHLWMAHWQLCAKELLFLIICTELPIHLPPALLKSTATSFEKEP